MTDYLTNDTDLTSVADAIRTKGGTSAALEWPDGFVDAIDAIPTGSSITTASVHVEQHNLDLKNVYYIDANGQIAQTGPADYNGVTVNAAIGSLLVAQSPQPGTTNFTISGATILHVQGSASGVRYATAICEVTG